MCVCMCMCVCVCVCACVVVRLCTWHHTPPPHTHYIYIHRHIHHLGPIQHGVAFAVHEHVTYISMSHTYASTHISMQHTWAYPSATLSCNTHKNIHPVHTHIHHLGPIEHGVAFAVHEHVSRGPWTLQRVRASRCTSKRSLHVTPRRLPRWQKKKVSRNSQKSAPQCLYGVSVPRPWILIFFFHLRDRCVIELVPLVAAVGV